MKRIEMLADVKDDGSYYLGEIRVVSDEKAEYFCRNGWAKDPSGQLVTGKPDLKDKTLDVVSSTHAQRGKTPGA